MMFTPFTKPWADAVSRRTATAPRRKAEVYMLLVA